MREVQDYEELKNLKKDLGVVVFSLRGSLPLLGRFDHKRTFPVGAPASVRRRYHRKSASFGPCDLRKAVRAALAR